MNFPVKEQSGISSCMLGFILKGADFWLMGPLGGKGPPEVQLGLLESQQAAGALANTGLVRSLRDFQSTHSQLLC